MQVLRFREQAMCNMTRFLWLLVTLPICLMRDAILIVASGLLLLFVGLPNLLFRLAHPHPHDELYWRDNENKRSILYQVWLLVISVLPIGLLFWLFRLVKVFMINLTQDPQSLQSWVSTPEVTYKGPTKARPANNRTGFFVNGICVDKHWLRLNCETLQAFFDDQSVPCTVQGIYNPTNGFLVDLAECFVQRYFNFYTEPVLSVVAAVRTALEKNERVTLIGHSQGGIIVSLATDHLVTYYPDLLTGDKLHIYTFASAADQFVTPPAGVSIPVIKHYGNGGDVVAWLGVLGCFHFQRALQSLLGDWIPQYYGEVFYNPWTFGHLLSTFYVFRHPSPYVGLTGGGSRPF